MATRILIIDDSSIMRRIHKLALATLGYTNIIEAGDGLEALMKLEELKWKVDMVMLDWNMPVMDGFTVLTKMREIEAMRKTPILMVTSEATEDRIAEAKKAGATGYLTKPFNASKLKETLLPILGPAETPGT